MDVKAFPALIVGVVVALVLAGAVLPVFAETTSATDTFKNEGLRYIKATSEDSYTLVWDPATPNKATVNGEDYTIWKTGDGTRNISIVMVPDTGIIRYNVNSSGVISGGIQVVGLTGMSSATNGFTFSYESGTYTLTNDSTTITGTSDVIYAIGNGGDYVLKNPNDRSYLVKDSNVLGMGVTQVIAWNNGFQIEGDNFQIEGDTDNIEVSSFNPGTVTYTITNVADDLATVDNYVDLYTLNKVTFTVTGTPTEGDPVTVNATYSYFLVPYEVTAEKSVHPDGPLTVILNVLPLLAIAGLVTGAVVWFINRKG